VGTRLASLIGLAVAAAAVPGGAQASALAAFHTPAWAAQCYVPFPHERPLSTTGLVCTRPSDGFTVTMGARTRPRWEYDPSARGYRAAFAAARLLEFGRHWAVRPFWHCVSQRTGLTCWNRIGHGWWLGGRGGFKTF
jgi:hypothetical protein